MAREMLFEARPDLVLHVVDAKNLERMLPLTLQLIEAGLPVVLQVNMMDEAERLGITVDAAAPGARAGRDGGRHRPGGRARPDGAAARPGAGRRAPLPGSSATGRPWRSTSSGPRGCSPRIFRSPRARPPSCCSRATRRCWREARLAGHAEAARLLLAEAEKAFRAPLPYAVALERQRLSGAVLAQVVHDSAPRGSALAGEALARPHQPLDGPARAPPRPLLRPLQDSRGPRGRGAGRLPGRDRLRGLGQPLGGEARRPSSSPGRPCRSSSSASTASSPWGCATPWPSSCPWSRSSSWSSRCWRTRATCPGLALLIDRVFKRIGL